jgi:rhodanese-related sulfurtransferase
MNALSGSLPWRDAAAILLVAGCLGFVYNGASPLGVRDAAADAAAAPPAARAAGAGSYSNETIAIGTQPPAVTGATAGLSNETLTAEIIRPVPAAAPPQPPQKVPVAVTWPEVKPLLAAGDIVLVDAREPAAFEAGHIPGAISLPFTQLNQLIGKFTKAYARSQPLVIYCASNQCPVARAEGSVLMEQFGYTSVREMPGGYAEWRVAEPAANPAAKGTP